MTSNGIHQPESTALLTFAEAARLTGQPKAYLRELAEAGRLAVRMIPSNGAPKLRLTQTGLIEAGLLEIPPPALAPAVEHDELAPLIALIREQYSQISALEEERFQLGAQLGAAIERVINLEARIETMALPDSDIIDEAKAIPAEIAETKPISTRSVFEFGERELRRSRDAIDRYLPGRMKFSRRNNNRS